MNDIEQRARALLAAEYCKRGKESWAQALEEKDHCETEDCALSVIIAALSQQQAAPEDLQKDAERYRWLRNNADIDPIFGDVVGVTFPAPDSLDGFNVLDEAIDAAMLAARPEVQS